MKHDVKTKYDISDEDIAEMLDSGYKLIAFSCGSQGDSCDTEYVEIYVFAKEITEGF